MATKHVTFGNHRFLRLQLLIKCDCGAQMKRLRTGLFKIFIKLEIKDAGKNKCPSTKQQRLYSHEQYNFASFYVEKENKEKRKQRKNTVKMSVFYSFI